MEHSTASEWPPPELTQGFYAPHMRRMARYHGSMRKLYQARYPHNPGMPRNQLRRNAHAFKAADSKLFSASARYLVTRMRKYHRPWPKWDQKGVVYAIFHCHARDRMPKRLLYVGQTYMTAFDRFRGHVSSAAAIRKGRGSQENHEGFWLHHYIARNGIDKLCVVPLEKILWAGGPPDPDSAQWREAAMQVERRLVQWLQSLHPTGYNKYLPGSRQRTFSQVNPDHGLWQPLPYAYAFHSDSSGCTSTSAIPPPYDYRGYYRRIEALAELITNRPDRVPDLMPRYRTRNLVRMFELVRSHRVTAISDTLQAQVSDIISQELETRRSRSRPVTGPRPLIVCYFVNWLMDELPLHQIIASDEVMALLPQKLKDKHVRPMIAFKNPPTIGQLWCNYASVFDGSTLTYAQLQHIALHGECMCHAHPAQFKPDGHDGHVVTCQPDFLAHAFPDLPNLPRLMKEGKKYRPPRATEVSIVSMGQALTHVSKGLNAFAERQTRDYKLDSTSVFHAWQSKVQTLVEQALFQMPQGHVIQHHGAPSYGPREKEAIESLQQHFVCTYCDKSANNMAFVCKKHAIKAVLDDMHRGAANSDSTYHQLDTSAEAIIRSLQATIGRVGKPPDDDALPVISLLPKMHKDPISWRFLSLSYKSFLRPTAILLTRALRGLQPDMFKIWDTLQFPAAGGWNCWVLMDSAAFMPIIHDFNASRTLEQHDFPPYLHQSDFQRLYTELDQQDLVAKLHDFVDLAFARHPDRVLKVSNRKAKSTKWVKLSEMPQVPRNRESYLSAQGVKELITLIVRHAYAQVGDAIFRQVKGIPMGVNPACFFANLYLFMYELRFFQQLLALDTPSSKRVLHAFRFTGRLIDDVNTITHERLDFVQKHFYNDQVHDGIRGIYPSSLNLQDSSCVNPHHSNFLDLHIRPTHDDHGPLHTSIFDKRRQAQFRSRLKAIRFPAPYSMLSRRCKLNVFDSQFIRFTRLVTDVNAFIDSVAGLMHELVMKGYPPTEILKRCRFQVRDNPHLYGTSPGVSSRYRHARGLFRAIAARFQTIMRVSFDSH